MTSYLLNKRGFLGETAKRISKSAAGFYFAHDIVAVDQRELYVPRCRKRRNSENGKDEDEKEGTGLSGSHVDLLFRIFDAVLFCLWLAPA